MKGLCEQVMANVNQFSLVWWIFAVVWLLCWPGIIVGGLVVLIFSIIAMILLAIFQGLIALIGYFLQNLI